MEREIGGVIVVDKPEGWTSHDVVNRMRRLANTKRVGHLGTLDPMATGVLPLLLGRATRLAQFFGADQKGYEATIRFGFSTDTYDREGQPTSPPVTPTLDRALLETELTAFRGAFEQVPPAISAKKIQGQPAYKLARKNIAVDLPPVPVTVHELTLLAVNGNTASVRVRCSSGTYVRSIAHDLGIRLGYGAHLSQLRRTASGDFTVDQAHTLESLDVLARSGRLEEALIPSAGLLPGFPSEFVDDQTTGYIRQGRDFRVSPFRVQSGARFVKALTQDGVLLAIGEQRLPLVYHPVCVL